jgi:hypothetical protein
LTEKAEIAQETEKRKEKEKKRQYRLTVTPPVDLIERSLSCELETINGIDLVFELVIYGDRRRGHVSQGLIGGLGFMIGR